VVPEAEACMGWGGPWPTPIYWEITKIPSAYFVFTPNISQTFPLLFLCSTPALDFSPSVPQPFRPRDRRHRPLTSLLPSLSFRKDQTKTLFLFTLCFSNPNGKVISWLLLIFFLILEFKGVCLFVVVCY